MQDVLRNNKHRDRRGSWAARGRRQKTPQQTNTHVRLCGGQLPRRTKTNNERFYKRRTDNMSTAPHTAHHPPSIERRKNIYGKCRENSFLNERERGRERKNKHLPNMSINRSTGEGEGCTNIISTFTKHRETGFIADEHYSTKQHYSTTAPNGC